MRVCDEEGCGVPHLARGKCKRHYQTMRNREKDPLIGTRRKMPEKCTLPDCDRPYSAGGLCKYHVNRRSRTGDPTTPPKYRKFEPGDRNVLENGYAELKIPGHPGTTEPRLNSQKTWFCPATCHIDATGIT